MSTLPYDITSPNSILEYAKGLSGRSLAQVADLEEVKENLKNKGDLGSMVEKYYFHHTPPNDHEPDFAEAGVELKTTGVKKHSGGQYQAKERLVLTMINYMTLVEENWESSSMLHKCRYMLLLFYLYEKELPVYDRKFVYEPLLWAFPEADLKIIANDWEIIRRKVLDGKAHELSEGDTFYLGACRKGAGGPKEPLRKQPFSYEGAKARAFSLKPSYMNTILSGHAKEADLFSDNKEAEIGIEAATEKRFQPYIGKSVEDISRSFGIEHRDSNDKGFFKRITMRMLGTEQQTVPELEKAGIEVKTVRLEQTGMPKEHMSFPNFDYLKIVDEDWENTSFYNKLEKKFLLVVFKFDSQKVLRLHRVMYWNMPYADREEARKVWELTKLRISIYQDEQLPKSSENRVAHVRPKGKDSHDVIPAPSGRMLPKKCFWLNKSYIAEQIAKK